MSGMDSSGEATAPSEASAPEGKRDFVAEERAQRIAKQERLTARTGPAYRFDRDHTLAEIRDEFGELDPGRETETAVRVAGRIRLIRRHGGLVFADSRTRPPPSSSSSRVTRSTRERSAISPTSIEATGSARRPRRCVRGWASSRCACATGRC
jgi:hypothetical protein